jgi:hypothetical protein
VFDKRLRINVAMKVVRNVPKYRDGAKIEAEILKKVAEMKEKMEIKGNSLVGQQSHRNHAYISTHLFITNYWR